MRDRAARPAARAGAAVAIDESSGGAAHSRASRGRRGTAPASSHLRGRPAGRPRRPLLFEVQRRRHGHHRRIGGAEQEIHREHRRPGELLRRPCERRVHRRAEPGEPDPRRAHPEERDPGVRARQDDLYRFVHRERRARLPLRYREHRDETGHVRRLDDCVARLRQHRRQGRREQRHGLGARDHLAWACAKPQL